MKVLELLLKNLVMRTFWGSDEPHDALQNYFLAHAKLLFKYA